MSCVHLKEVCGQSFQHFTIVNYNTRVIVKTILQSVEFTIIERLKDWPLLKLYSRGFNLRISKAVETADTHGIFSITNS